jgi:DNA-binding transcriptional LysR family regulator
MYMGSVSESFMLNVRRLRLLRELRDRGTVTAAAQAVHLTPSAVSQQLATLSREAGVPLLAKQGRGVRLTPQAHLLLDHAAVLATQLERARADLAAHADGDVGRVTVGAFATAITALVGPTITTLCRERPRLVVAVREIEPPECFSELETGRLDIVIEVDYQGGPPRTDPRYHRTDLMFDPFDAAVPADDPLAAKDVIDLTDLADRTWINGTGTGPCRLLMLSACGSAGFTPEVRHNVNTFGSALALVGAGAGVTLIPHLSPDVPPPNVVLRPLRQEYVGRHLYAAARAGSQYVPVIATVLDALTDQVLDRRASRATRP